MLHDLRLSVWMNMEDFITGDSGHDAGHRVAVERILGKEISNKAKIEFLFDL